MHILSLLLSCVLEEYVDLKVSFVTDSSYSVANSAIVQIRCFALSALKASVRQGILRYSAVPIVNVEALPRCYLPFDLLDLLSCSDQCCTSLNEK